MIYLNDFSMKHTEWGALTALTNPFLEELGHRNDGFWDDGVSQAEPHMLFWQGEQIGFCAVEPQPEGSGMLRAFYLLPSYRFTAQASFQAVLDACRVSSAMVPSNDEFFLCLSLETMRVQGGSLDLQAYNMTYGPPRREAEYGPESFSPVSDLDEMHAQTENMWSGEPLPEDARFYKVVEHGEVLGYGSLYPRRLDQEYLDVGNYVLPSHREKGVGRSILIQLSRKVLAEGKKPSAGCWYYNHRSICTLISSGFLPNSRIFLVHFTSRNTGTSSGVQS